MQRQYLSIDIGGTEIKSALIDHSGNIFERNHVPTPHQKEAFLAAIFAVVEPVLEKVTAICVSLPGVVNPTTGEVKFTGALALWGPLTLRPIWNHELIAQYMLVMMLIVRH